MTKREIICIALVSAVVLAVIMFLNDYDANISHAKSRSLMMECYDREGNAVLNQDEEYVYCILGG